MTISLRAQKNMVSKKVPTMPNNKLLPQCQTFGVTGYCSAASPTSVISASACPCCQRQLDDARETVGDMRFPGNISDSLFKDDGSDSDSCEDWDEQDHMMPGLLSDGVAYCVKKVLVQGWIHKKGTGTDWFASRAWKPRWAVLALVSIPGHEAYVPVLQIYWYSNSPSPSMVIHLDSAVVLPEDDSDRTKWNSSRFRIRHVKKSVDESSVQMTRTFSCPREGRDRWVYAINEALLEYEKEKAHARKLASMSLSPPRKQLPWATADPFPSKISRRPADLIPTPPSSPRSRPFRLMEPDFGPALLGEAFLDLEDE